MSALFPRTCRTVRWAELKAIGVAINDTSA